jgi:hypothetical protein
MLVDPVIIDDELDKGAQFDLPQLLRKGLKPCDAKANPWAILAGPACRILMVKTKQKSETIEVCFTY